MSSLFDRQPRPLMRGEAHLRDDRLFIIACDDTFAPKQYFNFFQLSRIQIHVVPTVDGSSAASHVLTRLLEVEHAEYDERWLLLDTDHCIQGTHLAGFTNTLAEARRRGVKVALSKPSFEFWLLLHHVDESELGLLATAQDVEENLRIQVGQYNKTSLKREHYPCSSVYEACIRAKRLDQRVSGGDIPLENTSRVYLLWKSIVAKALPLQLPEELRKLLM